MEPILMPANMDGDVDFLIQGTEGNTGPRTVMRRMAPRRVRFNWLPLSEYTYGESRACLLAGLSDHRLIRLLARELGWEREVRSLGPGSYMIRRFKRKKGDCLMLVGGDLAAFHYALSDAAGWMSFNHEGLIYGGGERIERPVFKVRAYWHNDTRTRWNPDCRFPVSYTCLLDYPEDAGKFVDNFRRVVDGMVDYRRNMLSIFGFVRSEHGGVEAAQEICRYARAHGIDVVPGVGTHFYGGPWYRGRHPFNLDTYMQRHRNRLRFDDQGLLRICPTSTQDVKWLLDGIRWLFETFDIQGVTLENGDYFVCHCPRCRRTLKRLGGKSNPEFYNAQALCYLPVLKELERIPQAKWSIYATYRSFSPLDWSGLDPIDPCLSAEEKARRWKDCRAGRELPFQKYALREKPAFAKLFPERAIAQWNVDGMLRRCIPERAFLDDGCPGIVYEGPLWPRSFRSPVKRNVFYSTSSLNGGLCLSIIKELAIRAAEGNHEGTVDYGERSPKEIPVEINYLAQSYFAYHPFDNLRQFARSQLASRTGGEKEAEEWMEILCRKQAGAFTPEDRRTCLQKAEEFAGKLWHTNATRSHPADYSVERFANFVPYSYWYWLAT